MEAFLLTWLGALTLAALTLAGLSVRLCRRRDVLSWTLLLFFSLSLGLIWIKWYLRLDLALYDAPKYHYLAGQIAGLLMADFWGNLPYILKPYGAYTLPLGFLYFLLGVSEPLGQTLNALVGLGVILNIHRLSQLWFTPRIADRTAWFLALYPFFWILGSTLNRDMLIIYCITWFFISLAQLHLEPRGRRRFRTFLLLGASLVYMTLLRPPLIILAGLSSFVFWITPAAPGPRRHWLLRLGRIMAIIAILGLGSSAYLVYGRYYLSVSPLEQEAGQFSPLEEINSRLRISEKAGSAYLKGLNFSSFGEVLQVMPVAACYFLLAPLPWQVASIKQALGLLDSFWLLLVYLYFLKGIRELVRRQRRLAWALLTFVLLGVALSGVMQANAGSAMRHRPMFTLLLFPVAVYGWGRLRQPKDLERRQPVPLRNWTALPQTGRSY